MTGKKFIIIFCLLGLLASFGFALAQGALAQGLETEYPDIPGQEAPTEETSVPQYIKYIINFALWIGGALAFVFVVIGGVRYVFSAVNPVQQNQAKNQILSALLGLLVLVSSWVMLRTINPDLVTLRTERLSLVDIYTGPGILLCTEEMSGMENFDQRSPEEQKEILQELGEKCHKVRTAEPIPQHIRRNLAYIYIKGSYGAVLHEEAVFTGKCKVATSSEALEAGWGAITPFLIREEAQGEGVTLYELKSFEVESGTTLSGPYQGNVASFKPEDKMDPCESIEIDKDREWVAVLFSEPDFKGLCAVYDSSVENLEPEYVDDFCREIGFGFWDWINKRPCVKSMRIFKGKIR